MTEWIEVLISKNQFAIVDKEDLDLVNSRKWKAKWVKNTNSYVAVRCSSMVSGKRGSVYMHRLITGAPKGFVVDHINHNTLDNRKCNLRIVSHSDNQKNSRLKSHNTSGVCGVSWSKQASKWQSQIMSCGKYMHLGYFSNLFDAVCVRKSAEILHNFHVNHGKKLS